MKERVGSWYSSQELEQQVQHFWEVRGIFRKLVEKNARGEPWSFMDGPITANNPMGIHHAWGRSLKDAYQRYHAMQGRRLRYQNGFDCQGLWVEVEVEKELGLGSKREIEAYGVARFVERCKERVRTYARRITEQSVRLGTWMDWDSSYYTMSDQNNYMIWRFLKRCHERKLVYQGHDVMPWCPRCGTGISQHEMQEGYRVVTHRTALTGFPVEGRPHEHLLAWTTTPWTLTANVALAVHPELVYVTARSGDRLYHLAESRLAAVMAPHGSYEIVSRRNGTALVAETAGYVGPFDHLEAFRAEKARHKIITWTGVSAEEGTGIVHVAPGCGPEDFALSREHELAAPCPVDADGKFLPGYGEYSGLGAAEVSTRVLDDLGKRGFLLASEKHRHTYPHCWRCGQELLYRLVDEWFISMDPWRADIIKAAESARWVPAFCRDQELDWLRNMRDWMISKKRYWGLALPIWVCPACTAFEVVGSREELRVRAVSGWDRFEGLSPHRPQIDAVTVKCRRCGAEARRIPDVGNPWLDAGIVPYSTTGFPDGDEWRSWVPADLVVEGFPQQFRGWFYSLLAMSTMLEGVAPFRTLVGHASVRDERGEEMHKSRGNAIWLDDALKEAGADTVRWLFYGQDLATNLDFSFRAAKAIRGGFLNTLWNCHTFYVSYAALTSVDAVAELGAETRQADVLERWIVARLHETIAVCTRAFEGFDIRGATRAVESFVDSLSNVYIRQRRRLFWHGGGTPAGVAAYNALRECLTVALRLTAPLLPHLAERMYQNVEGTGGASAPESVHLCDYPKADTSLIDQRLLHAMESTRRVQQAALSARKEAGVKVRQPLARLEVAADAAADVGLFEDLLRQEVNVHAVDIHGPVASGVGWAAFVGGQLRLDTRITPELAREGMVRELLRRLQLLRREMGLEIDDRIELWLDTDSTELRQALAQHEGYLMEELLCVRLNTGDAAIPDGREIELAGARIRVAVRRAP